MAKRGSNIYKRKDGRFEGRVPVGYNDNGKIKYKSVYAKTPFKCWIVSAVLLLLVLLFIGYVDSNMKFYDLIALIGSIIIIFVSPVEDKNKPLDSIEKVVYKKRCIFVFAVELLLTVALRFFQKNDISICIEITWAALSVMLIVGRIKNGIIAKKLEETNE